MPGPSRVASPVGHMDELEPPLFGAGGGAQSPRAAGTVRFAVIGDYGSPGPAQREVAELIVALRGWLPDDAIVADIVYVPLETGLLKAARARGLRTSDGLGMLLHQAGRGFELWFGVRPKVTRELRALVEAELLKKYT